MNKCKCEYYSKVTGEKEIAMMANRFDFINIMDENNIDFDKEIRIFEKDGEWKLVHHIVNGKTIYKNFPINKEKEAEKYAQALQRQNNLEDIVRLMTTEICPSRKESQSFIEILFDGLYCGEDISKPKLQVIGTESKNKVTK